MELTVRYAKRDELERVNELRRAVSELHANGRPDIFRPGFGGDLSERVYSAFDDDDTDVIAAVCGGTVCGFALVHRIDKPESPYMCARRIYHIEEFGVDSDFRRRGVGSALIGFCRSEAARGLRAHLARRLVLQRICLEILRIPRIPHVPKLHGGGRVISPADRQVGGIGAERTPTVRSALLLCLPRGTSDGRHIRGALFAAELEFNPGRAFPAEYSRKIRG